jgi:predicted ATPase
LAGIDGALALAGETGEHWFDAGLHRIRGEILIKQNPADPAPAEAAFLAAIAVAQQQKARSFELRAALSLAKLYQSTGRPIDAHDVLAPALEGFSPTPEFPAIGEAKALFEALAADEKVKSAAARRAQRLKLQTEYGQAVMWGKGFAADETKDAFARAAELATRIGGPEAPLDAYVARWAHSYFRGELGLALEAAESLLRGAERAARPTEAATGHRLLGLTRLVQGDFAQAREHCEQALRIYDPERDREAKFRLGVDTRAMATSYLAHAAWHRGEVSGAAALMDEAVAHAAESAHVPTIVGVYLHQAWLEDLRDDAEAAQRAAEAAVALSREHGLMSYLIWAALPLAWARAKIGDRDAGSAELRQALADYANQGNKFQLPFYLGLLAEIEAEGGGAEAALTGIDEAFALANETGEHWFDAGLHRIRGEILIKQNPADPAPAEAAFLAAIAVAQHQKASSFELRAALSLARLYQSIGRPIDAHDMLGPALAGFSPTPEFPAIGEAKALFEALTADEGVKGTSASRHRRLHLQVAYGNALIGTRGYDAIETKAAFERANELAAGVQDVSDRLSVSYGLWLGSFVRGDLEAMRAPARALLRDCAKLPNSPVSAVGHGIYGRTKYYEGDFAAAREHFEQGLAYCDPERDNDVWFTFGMDGLVSAQANLAFTLWPLGEFDRARHLAEAMTKRAERRGHALTSANALMQRAMFEMFGRNFGRAAPAVKALSKLVETHEFPTYIYVGIFLEGWVQRGLDRAEAGIGGMRRGIALLDERKALAYVPFYKIALAEAEAEVGEMARALATARQALAQIEQTQQRWCQSEGNRALGEILLKQNPADPAPAEAAFLAAIAVAQHQKARSFELRAALSLAKLYQSTGRPTDAHDVLGPALAGFSPTPEFPQIAEAKALFETLAHL